MSDGSNRVINSRLPVNLVERIITWTITDVVQLQLQSQSQLQSHQGLAEACQEIDACRQTMAQE